MAGAAEGLGAAFSKELAQQGFNLILLDKNAHSLKSKVEELSASYPVSIQSYTLELALPESPVKMASLIKGAGCRLIIYNAAFGPVKRFTEHSAEALNYTIDVNSRAPMLLLHQLIKEREDKEALGFMQMTSLAGMLGTNLVAPYSATKAFNLALSEALYFELKTEGIDVMACIAGATDTPNFRATNPAQSFLSPTPMKPEKVVGESLRWLGKKPYHIAGFSNRFTAFLLNRILGRKAALGIMNRTMQRMYGP